MGYKDWAKRQAQRRATVTNVLSFPTEHEWSSSDSDSPPSGSDDPPTDSYDLALDSDVSLTNFDNTLTDFDDLPSDSDTPPTDSNASLINFNNTLTGFDKPPSEYDTPSAIKHLPRLFPNGRSSALGAPLPKPYTNRSVSNHNKTSSPKPKTKVNANIATNKKRESRISVSTREQSAALRRSLIVILRTQPKTRVRCEAAKDKNCASSDLKRESKSVGLIPTVATDLPVKGVAMKMEVELDLKTIEPVNTFPRASIEDCKSTVKKASGNMQFAFDLMEKERGGDLKEESIEHDHDNNENTFSTQNDLEENGHTHTTKPSSWISAEPGWKRKHGPEFSRQEPSSKRPRTSNQEGTMSLEPATTWVKNLFTDGRGIAIILETLKHPCYFPKQFLIRHFKFFRDYFRIPANTKGPSVSVSGIRREMFDLIVQWTVCKRIQLDTDKYESVSQEITAVLEMVGVAAKLGVHGFNQNIYMHLTGILSKDRAALRGEHIRTAYTFNSPNPIQDVFARAAIRPYYEFRDVEGRQSTIMAYEDDDGYYNNEARRAAFQGNLFRFDREMKLFPKFELQLLRVARVAWHSRVVEQRRGRGPRTFTTFLNDPLTGERFEI